MRHQSPKNRPTTLSWTYSGSSTSTLGPTCSRPSTAPRNRNWFPTDLGQLVFPSFMQHAGRPTHLPVDSWMSFVYIVYAMFGVPQRSVVRSLLHILYSTRPNWATWSWADDCHARRRRPSDWRLFWTTSTHGWEPANRHPGSTIQDRDISRFCGWVRVGNISEIHILSTDVRVSDTARDLAVVNVCTVHTLPLCAERDIISFVNCVQ